jgi:hypothetical protein
MSNRSERREAERLARKLAYRQLRQQPAQSPDLPETAAEPQAESSAPNPISEAQLAANRANAQLSTGPVTPEGRAKSSMNALKHGLTGKTVLLPNEDPAQYQQELNTCIEHFQPAGADEQRIVQSLFDCQWRLNRIQLLETSILYKGHLEAADKFADKLKDRPEIERHHFTNAEAYLAYEKQLRNLYIQEARLRRAIEKYTAELVQLQTKRRREESAAQQVPIKAAKPATPANGFEFSSQPSTPPATAPPDQKQQKNAA